MRPAALVFAVFFPVFAAAEPLPPGALARLGSTRLRHAGPVNCVAFSPRGQLLASGGDDRLVRFWDPTTGAEVGRIDAQAARIAFTPDGHALLAGDDNGNLHLWDVDSGEELWRDDTNNPSVHFVLTPDGHGFVIPTGDHAASVSLRDLRTGEELNRFEAGFALAALALSADGNLLAGAGTDGNIILWNLRSMTEVFCIKSASGKVPAIAFSPDGKLLASCNRDDDRLVFWDAQTGKESHQGDEKLPFGREIAFAPDGKTVATGSGWMGGEVRLWDVATGKSLRVLAEHPRGVGDLRFSRDGKLLAVTFWSDHAVRLWDWAAAKEVSPVDGHASAVIGAALGPGARSASTADRNSVRTWAVTKEGAPTGSVPTLGSGIDAVRFTPDGRSALVAFTRLRHFDALRWIELDPVKIGEPLGREVGSTALALALDGTAYAGGTAFGGAAQYDLPTGEKRRDFGAWNDHRSPVLQLAYSPDGRLLAVGHREGELLLWKARTGRLLFIHKLPVAARQLLFSPDGRTLAVLGETEVVLVETASWQTRGLLNTTGPHATILVFAPSGRALIAGGPDGSLWWWDLRSNRPAPPRRCHDGAVSALAFSPDGKTLITGSADTTALIWDVASLNLP
jgi:WD40 repeat protein